MIRNPLHLCARLFGFHLVPKNAGVPKDMDSNFRPIYELAKDYTMTSVNAMYALYSALTYLHTNHIAGDIVECGVWKGGSSMVVAETLSRLDDTKRTLYLYDTFTGMPQPDDRDIKIRTGATGANMWHEGWCEVGEHAVREALSRTTYPEEKIKLVPGKIEDTIPHTAPEKIALLRLDTDWFSSTYHELTHLLPRVVQGGVVIIDDYGSWSGAREATDTYFSEHNLSPYLHRIDTARLFIVS